MIFEVKDGFDYYNHNKKEVNIETIEDLERLTEEYDYRGWHRAIIVDFEDQEIVIYNDYME